MLQMSLLICEKLFWKHSFCVSGWSGNTVAEAPSPPCWGPGPRMSFSEVHLFMLVRLRQQKIKEENERTLQEYGFCIMDNHRERIANFRIEPPGLFRGRGDHPKMGMLKRRIRPQDIIINCSKWVALSRKRPRRSVATAAEFCKCLFFCRHRDSKHPEPPPGTRWKEVRHDNKVTWLVSWTENIQGSIKYIMLNPSSRIKVLTHPRDYILYTFVLTLCSALLL